MAESIILVTMFIVGLTAIVLIVGMMLALIVILAIWAREDRRSRILTKGIKKEAEKEEEKRLR